MKYIWLAVTLLFTVHCPEGRACWGTSSHTSDISERFHHAKYVVVAAAEEVSQVIKHRYEDAKDRIEDTRFRVIYRFKGDRDISQTLSSHSDLEFGCSVSALNQPVWLEKAYPVAIPLSPEVPPTPVKISGVWLIFADMEPFILEEPKSQPIELVSGADWIKLFHLSELNPRQ